VQIVCHIITFYAVYTIMLDVGQMSSSAV